ncbi:MAG: hypothetical protein MJ094_01195 [Saccharofermentans sp.]|nr:hypothetical protein [Saccharofermentans sp.]
MKYTYLYCNHCGAQVQLNPGRQRTFCSSCGTQIIAEEVYDKDSVEALLSRAESHMEHGDYARARRAYEGIAELHPYVHYGWEGLIRVKTKDYVDVIDYSDTSVLSSYMNRIKQTAPEDMYDNIKNKYITYAKTVSPSIALSERFTVESRLESCEQDLSNKKEKFEEDKQKYEDLMDEARSKQTYIRQAYEIPATARKIVVWASLALLFVAFVFSIIVGEDFESKFALVAGTSVPGILVLIIGLDYIKLGMSKNEYEHDKGIINHVITSANEAYQERLAQYKSETGKVISLQNKFKAYLSMGQDYLNRQVFNRLMEFDDNHEVDQLFLEVEELLG